MRPEGTAPAVCSVPQAQFKEDSSCCANECLQGSAPAREQWGEAGAQGQGCFLSCCECSSGSWGGGRLDPGPEGRTGPVLTLPQSTGDADRSRKALFLGSFLPSPNQRAHIAAIHQKASHWEPRTAPAPYVQLLELELRAEQAGHQAGGVLPSPSTDRSQEWGAETWQGHGVAGGLLDENSDEEFLEFNSFCEASMPTSVLEAGRGPNEMIWPPQGAAGGTRIGFSSNL